MREFIKLLYQLWIISPFISVGFILVLLLGSIDCIGLVICGIMGIKLL